MRPPTTTRQSKNYFLNPIVTIGLFSGALITALIWLEVPNQIIAPLSWFSLGLIGLKGFLHFRQPTLSQPPWIKVLVILAAVSLVYLFPELFGPACGGMPRAFALDCPPECRKEKCIHWEAGPSEACPKPGKGGGCCLEYKTTCDPDCEPPPPPDQPPTIAGTITCTQWGENSWCVNNATLKLIANEPQGKQLQISGNVGGTPFVCPAGNGSVSCSVPLPEGAVTVNYLATSITGLTGSGSKTYQYDSTLPKIDGWLNGITGANGWFISSVDVNASASDPEAGSGISAFEYTLNPLSGTGNGGWSNFPGTLSFTAGVHSLSLRASDVAGNVVETDQTIQVDTTTPTLDISIVGTVGANSWYSSTIQVSAAAADSGSGLGAFEYDLDSAGWATYSGPLELTDGIHSLSLRVIDNAGNLTEGTQTFLIDTVTPAIDLSLVGTESANGWYNSAVQVSASANDSGAGLSALEVSADNGAWYAYSAPLVFGDGLHTYQFRANDNAGNLAETALQQIQVDTIPPVIVLPESWELGEIAAFELQDDGSGLASVRLVIEDEDERYPKVTWDEGLGSYKFKGDINWDGRFKDGQLAPPGGEYYAWLKASDNAGNESRQAGQITVPLGSFMEELILPPGDQNGNLVSGTETSESIVKSLAPLPTSSGTVPAPQPPATNALPPISFGGRNNGAAQPSNAQAGKVSFNAGGPSNSPATNSQSNLLWGATATAAIGAFAAEIARKKAEEEARIAAKAKAKERQENRASSDFRQKAKASKMAQLEAKWAAAKQAAQIRAQIVRARILGQKEMEVELEMRSLSTKAQAQQEPAEAARQKAYDAYRAQEVAAQTKIAPQQEAEKSWLDKAIDWVDNNQVVTSIGIGVAIGLVAAAIILTGGAAAPVIFGAVALAGVVTGGGTIALNARYSRDWNENLVRNLVITVGTTILTAGITVVGAKAIGTGMTFCTMNPTCSSLIEPAMKAVDFIEEASLVIKAGVQTFFGDSLGAGETLLELEMEHMDGGMPGNSLVKELGSESLETLAIYGDDAVELIGKYGDDAIDIIIKYGNDAVDIIGTYGDEGITLLSVYGNDAIDIVKEYGTPAVTLLRTLDLNAANKLLKNLDNDIIEYAMVQGPDAVTALSYWPDNFLKNYGGELALRAKQDARALEAASKYAKLDNINTQEAKELLDTIAYNSIQNSGDRLVLGKWVSGTLDEGFIGVARADGALFYGTNPGIEEIFAKTSNVDPEDLYWAVNNRVLEIATEQNIKIDYSLSGLSPEKVPVEVSAIEAMQSGMTSDDVAEKFFRGDFPFRMKEIEVLIAHGYTLTVDATNNIIHWSKP